MSARNKTRGRPTLRPDTALAPAEVPHSESYVRELPGCCLWSLKAEVAVSEPERRLLSLDCECGRSWRVTSSLDEKVLRRFIVHGGPRTGGSPPAA